MFKTSLAHANVPPVLASDRSECCSPNGKPIFLISSLDNVFVNTRRTYSGQCVVCISSSVALGDGFRSIFPLSEASSRNARRVSAYLSMGNLCPSGSITRAQSA